MKGYILDANIIFSGVLSQKDIYKKIFDGSCFFIPDFALIELGKYKNIILSKSKLKAATLTDFTLHIFSKITVVPDFLISKKSLETAQELCREIDIKDSIYIALAIELDLILLTRDKELYQGLKLKGFTKIELFDAFIDQISNKGD